MWTTHRQPSKNLLKASGRKKHPVVEATKWWNYIPCLRLRTLETIPSSAAHKCFSQKKGVLYSTANDPQPQMILDRKWSPKSTANDPVRKIGITWTQVGGSSCRFYYYYQNVRLKAKFYFSNKSMNKKKKKKKSFKCKNEVGRQHTTFTSC